MSHLHTAEPLGAFLCPLPLVDFDHPLVRAQLARYNRVRQDETQFVCDTFEFVRDQIAHSWDIGSRRVTARASEVLEHREGICYAKSHLLAALLRGQGIPCGFAYQRLTLGDTPDMEYCVHALNTAYLASLGRWIRLDARGNKPGIDARFSAAEECLAFPVRPECGEFDYPTNHAQPHPRVVETLAAHDDCRMMYAYHLPTDLQ